jgi:UDP-N-acetylglucosamine--N-acetylmuramyl-(pentapeptide) pyrophosphoryl-undecaprenol N-acetylglucosamine transferase
MKVLITAGGGGHFSPALAVIEQVPKDWEVLLVGRKYAFEGDPALSLEYQTARRLGLHFIPLTTGRLQRRFTKRSLMSLLKIPVGLAQAFHILTTYKPDVALSFGGYVSLPVVLTAAVLRVPIVVHEQTFHAGLANKIASRFAKKICISWQQSASFFPKEKTVLTGNPLRKAFFQKVSVVSRTKNENFNKKVFDTFNTRDNRNILIYITGGSGGAHGINILIEGCLSKLLEKYTIIHQTGDAGQFGDFDRLEKLRLALPADLKKSYEVKKFIEPGDVMGILSRADLIVSRAGVNTVTELLYLGKPCLLIPLPYGQQKEQLTNARFVHELGLAEIADQSGTTSVMLLQKINLMISRLHFYKKHTEDARRLIHTDAAEKIIEEVCRAKN